MATLGSEGKMAADDSNLSAYGHDFVVSITQENINVNLRKYFTSVEQPVQYLPFVAGPHGPVPMSLDSLMATADGINPFQLAADISITDQHIEILRSVGFVFGIVFQLGLPADVAPKDLPVPTVILGQDANNVLFTMYCKQVKVIYYFDPAIDKTLAGLDSPMPSPGQDPNPPRRWFTFFPEPDEFWYAQAKVNLVFRDLSSQLDTGYFDANPEEKTALLSQFGGISGSDLRLQQLVLDLDNAVVLPSSKLGPVVNFPTVSNPMLGVFLEQYQAYASKLGHAFVTINAGAQTADASQWQLTSINRQASPLVDTSGSALQQPTRLQQSASTLDLLCMVNAHPPHEPSPFNWNWIVKPKDVNSIGEIHKGLRSESGIIAMSKNMIAGYIKEQLLLLTPQLCLVAQTTVSVTPFPEDGITKFEKKWGYSISDGGVPITTANNTGDVVSLFYGQDSGDSRAGEGQHAAGLRITCEYSGVVAFHTEMFTISHNIVIGLSVADGFNVFDYDKAVNITQVVEYSLQVTEEGDLVFVPNALPPHDNSETLSQLVTPQSFQVDEIFRSTQNSLNSIASHNLANITIPSMRNKVFPGGQVVTFRNARFTDNQDLVCDISYIQNPSAASTTTKARTEAALTSNMKADDQQSQAKAQPTEAGPNLTYTSDMIHNYLQGEIVSPQSKFEALQKSDGLSLLFSLDTAGQLLVTEEHSGAKATGWVANDLAQNSVVSNFDVGQSTVDGTIHLAMAVSSGTSDLLSISLGNSHSDTKWISNPTWLQCPFDDIDDDNPTSPVKITGILFSEAADLKKPGYLLVDVDRSTNANVKNIVRYYVDPTNESGQYWTQQDVPVDIQADSYQSCAGRLFQEMDGGVFRQTVDGVYTAGTAGGVAQLVYTPIINLDDPDLSPRSTVFTLPSGFSNSVIAAARYPRIGSADLQRELQGTTDLYVAAGSAIFRYPAKDTSTGTFQDGRTFTKIMDSSILAGTSKLIATIHGGFTTIWGTNTSLETYYISCPNSQLSDASSWGVPVPVLSQTEHITTFVNRSDGSNTIFASGGGRLQRLLQATDSLSKLWTTHDIKVEAPDPKPPALSFTSFTTTIIASDSRGLPAAKVPVSISANRRSPLYINGLYYVLTPTPITIPTDPAGIITVIEPTDNMNGTVLSVSTQGGSSQSINPMANGVKKLTALKTQDDLNGAQFYSDTVAGGYLDSSILKPLVSKTANQDDVKEAAANIDSLGKVVADLTSSKKSASSRSKQASGPKLDLSEWWHDFKNGVERAWGDLVQAMKAATADAIKKFKVFFDDVWHFIVKIGDEIYHAVINAIEDAATAIWHVIQKILDAAKDATDFLQVLLSWDDIRRTQKVTKNLIKCWIDQGAKEIQTLKHKFDTNIIEAEAQIDKLSQLTTVSNSANQQIYQNPPGQVGGSNPMEGQTSASSLLHSHFRNNISQMKILPEQASPLPDGASGAIQILLNMLADEKKDVMNTVSQFTALLLQSENKTTDELVVALFPILATGILQGSKDAIDALLDLLKLLMNHAFSILDTKIKIPVLTDILDKLGVPEISFLDVFLYIISCAITIPYKIAHDEKPPWPDNAATSEIIAASTWDELRAIFKAPASRHAKSATKDIASPREELTDLQRSLNFYGHIFIGIVLFTGNIVSTIEAMDIDPENALGTPVMVISAASTGMEFILDDIVPRNGLNDRVANDINYASRLAALFAKLLFWGPVQEELGVLGKAMKVGGMLQATDSRFVGAIVDIFLCFPEAYATYQHFVELNDDDAGPDTTSAILEEASNILDYVARCCYAPAVKDKDPDSKSALVVAMSASNVISSFVQVGIGFIK